MGKIILSLQMTLDGIVSDVDNWVLINDDMMEDMIKYYDNLDCVVFGGRSFPSMASYWKKAEEMSSSKLEKDFAKKINRIKKYVFSRTKFSTDWNNTDFIHLTEENDFDTQMNGLKKFIKGNISVEAGATSWQLFLQKKLFDEMWIFIHPILFARGLTLWDFLEDKIQLELIHSKTYNNGIVSLYYKKIEDQENI